MAPRLGTTSGEAVVAPRYHRVPWGKRLYLIAEGDELDFCNAVNLRGPKDGLLTFFYLRKEGRDQPIDGLPKLPEQWMRYLLREPVTAHVTEMTWEGWAKIDRGSDVGVFVGMKLCLASEGPTEPVFVKVRSVETTSSVVTYVDHWTNKGLEKGAVVTSRYDFAP